MKQQVLEGTWEEIKAHDRELNGRKVRLEVIDAEAQGTDEPESRTSTAADLLKHAVGWAGDDFEECLQAVYDNRSRARF